MPLRQIVPFAPRRALRGGWRNLLLMAGVALVFAVGLPFASAAQSNSGNLIVNGDAEAHRCTADWSSQTPIPGWRVLRGAASVLCYTAFARRHVHPSLPSAVLGGQALFAAPGADTAIEQLVDLGDAAAGIDAGGLTWSLAAWLGGASGGQTAMLSAIFLDADGRATRGPVVLSGPSTANTGPPVLAARSARGSVPKGTRRVRLTLQLPCAPSSFHNAFADNLRLEIIGAGKLPTVATLQPPAAGARFDRVFVVMMENTNYADAVDTQGRVNRARMPYLASLAERGLTLTNVWANSHPSDQNYIAMVAADTFVYGAVYYPQIDLTQNHLGDLLDAAAKPWRAYVQGMGRPCNLVADPSGSGHYAPDDQPFAHFRNVVRNPERCQRSLRDLDELRVDAQADRLPAFAWIAADGWWDGEGAWEEHLDVQTSLRRQDEFLRTSLSPLLDAPAWRGQRALLVLTWDESLGWGWPDNHIPTVLVATDGALPAGVHPGSLDTTHYDGYSVLRSVEDALDLPRLGRFDTYATPLLQATAANPPRLDAGAEAATVGSIDEAYGQAASPLSARRGTPIDLRVQAEPGVDPGMVVITPLDRAPRPSDPSYRLDPATFTVAIPTAKLAPGSYGAWRYQKSAGFTQAPLALQVLPASSLGPTLAGVEVRSTQAASRAPLELLQGGNIVVRYCRPAAIPAATARIAILQDDPLAEPAAAQSAAAPGDEVPAAAQAATGGATTSVANLCGETMLHTAGLAPEHTYRVQMYGGAGTQRQALGVAAKIRILPAAPLSLSGFESSANPDSAIATPLPTSKTP